MHEASVGAFSALRFKTGDINIFRHLNKLSFPWCQNFSLWGGRLISPCFFQMIFYSARKKTFPAGYTEN
jgi:hypothetical protein